MKAQTIVLDTAPLLHRTPLIGLADRFVTIHSVLAEVRDPSSREALESLPIQIDLKQPTEESIKAVTEFSKLTGDYPVLSKTDLHLLALCWMMEKEANGGKYLRSCPIPPKTVSKPALEPIQEQKEEKDLMRQMSDLILEDDGEGEWITPTNIQKSKSSQSKTHKKVWNVACMTSDFAMQNVLMQMGMKVLGEDGNVIKKLRLSVLRCHACYKSTKDMGKKFCPSCGNATLLRTSVGVDQNGNVIYFLKKNFQYNNRGTQYSIPLPKGGKKTNDIILREDQKEYQRALKTAAVKKKQMASMDLFDPDFSLMEGSLRSFNYGPQIGYGRKNPNEARRKRR